ncbi:DUF29 domain-containing protein [Halochromatium glycolicum]|uniref:DUF29 domain-containing protein n=1 Tax=Halochromatium glycolicum TaxID=85075 RepID=A0AAJ0X975_9GAMM|nr:DUF29 domain-containing protein [Halochromatium glycolicum]MBK1703387.1 hypothetical protein [Halochromatium glycolicum]
MMHATHNPEADYLQWLQTQVNHLRAGRLDCLDREQLVEELEGMSRSERRQLRNRLVVLMMHLLKLRHQPDKQSRSWTVTIITQRTDIKLLLRESPSLKPSLPEALAASYPRARQEAADETGLPLSTFPDQPPFTLDQVLDEDYWPEPGER